MFLPESREFSLAPCLAGRGGGDLTARVSMLLKSRASLTCFRACVVTCPSVYDLMSAAETSDVF